MALTTVRFRPLFGRIITIVIGVLAVVGLVGFAASGDWLGLARNFGTIGLIVVLVWAIFWRPELLVEQSGVTVVNVFATHHVPWRSIQRIDTRYTITIHTSTAKVAVWASPSPRRGGASAADGDHAVAVMCRHWQLLQDKSNHDASLVEQDLTRRDWHWKTITALATLLVLGIVLPFL